MKTATEVSCRKTKPYLEKTFIWVCSGVARILKDLDVAIPVRQNLSIGPDAG